MTLRSRPPLTKQRRFLGSHQLTLTLPAGQCHPASSLLLSMDFWSTVVQGLTSTESQSTYL